MVPTSLFLEYYQEHFPFNRQRCRHNYWQSAVFTADPPFHASISALNLKFGRFPHIHSDFSSMIPQSLPRSFLYLLNFTRAL